MTQFGTTKRVVISSDAEALADAVAGRLLSRLARRSAEGKRSHVALAGGAIGTAVLRAAGAVSSGYDIDWSHVHFWWSDEVFASRTDDERHERAARAALIDRIDVPARNVHTIAAVEDVAEVDAAAAAYAAELARFGDAIHPWPNFYVCFLGVGSDGHIASLFPDRAEIQITDRSVVPVRDAPTPPTARITLTRPVINSAQCVWLVVSGTDKAAALGLALAGASYETVPAAGAKGRRRTLFFIDEAAAGGVPPELIDPEF
ncbi:6-phosphogluconolactonase [Microbacterium sp.]|uniref:6-phosphogluconolactonase n=1 Tax=Microbacterium sp. TaxID=51671 RepID=UPI003C770E48